MLNSKKTYFSIREVCEITGLEPHVLRYWESEFHQLRPKKNRAGNRAYREKDIEIIRQIQSLVHVEKYTILGAKKKLTEIRRGITDHHDDILVEQDELPNAASNVTEPATTFTSPVVVEPPVKSAAPIERLDSFVLSMFDPQLQNAESFLSEREDVVRGLKEILRLLSQ